MLNVFLVLFWMTFLLCATTYIIYPITIYFFSKFCSVNVNKKDICPLVSIIISAFNEEQYIEEKIVNTLSLSYPKDKIEIIIGSDGSFDKTVEIAKKYIDQGIKIVDFEINRGKTAIQNECVKISKGEILIFTDAASFLNKDAIIKIVRNFADPRIGCVAGQLKFVNTRKNLTTESQGLYWRYEFKIREIESRLGRLIGVDGPLYAIRRENYVTLQENMISDFISPLLVLADRKKVVLEPEAIASEDPTLMTGQELNTRRRITLRALTGLATHAILLNPFKHHALSLQIFFHKLLRWFVGPLIIINVFACFTLSNHAFFDAILIGYLLFFMSALLGMLISHFRIKWRIFTVPYYFTLVNLAATLGIIDYFRRKQVVTWKPVRR